MSYEDPLETESREKTKLQPPQVAVWQSSICNIFWTISLQQQQPSPQKKETIMTRNYGHHDSK